MGDCNVMLELLFVIFIVVCFVIYREFSQKKYKQNMSELLAQVEQKNALLKRLSITDKLTGLNNRIKIDEVFSVILIDIDHFKKVNDTYGHPVGDEVLKDFASILKKSARITDVVGRWGGEEFMIIASETDSVGATKFATTIKKSINEHEFPKVGKITASFGLTQISIGDSLEEVVNRADLALYNAKETGRNRVVCGL
ncbi:MAG TPA: GGDEF domain-containing protein [Sulfurospirillum arcachonense]|nr:GGDEF domain-containing protein [Sulfurospirillum arcachonense]HIP44497.1 GGDEF domain-containing protein [Sulfurospirillum arcachonense]